MARSGWRDAANVNTAGSDRTRNPNRSEAIDIGTEQRDVCSVPMDSRRWDQVSLVNAVRAESVSPEAAALLIARDAHPGLDIGAELARLDALAAPLAGIDVAPDPDDQEGTLAAHLHGALGFRGNTDDYYDARNSYLDAVLTWLDRGESIASDELRRGASVMRDALERTNELIRRLRGFTRSAVRPVAEVDVHALLRDVRAARHGTLAALLFPIAKDLRDPRGTSGQELAVGLVALEHLRGPLPTPSATDHRRPRRRTLAENH